MFTNTLDAVKGWFHEAALDHSAEFTGGQVDNASVAITYKQGMCVSLAATGKYVLGISDTNVGIFLLNGEDDPDVANISFGGDHSHTASGDWIAIGPSGKLSGLVATGGYELETTEYVDAAYTIGSPLKSRMSSAPAPGKLQRGTIHLDNCVGIVSAAQVAGTSAVKNSHGQSVLRFWPIWAPAHDAATVDTVKQSLNIVS
jgi:hypothetical protein